MIAVASLLSVLVLSMFVTRIGAVALRLTGMAPEAARFQARSALTGAGFTTAESEQIVTHPVRRKVVGTLMLLGNLGIVAASGTLILSLVGIEEKADSMRLVVLAIGLIALYFFAMSKVIDRAMCGVIAWALARYTEIETRDFTTLLHIRGGYQIGEIRIERDDRINGKTLAEAGLSDSGVLVLGIGSADGAFEGAPRASHRIVAGETLIVYGQPEAVEELSCRCRLHEEQGGDEEQSDD